MSIAIPLKQKSASSGSILSIQCLSIDLVIRRLSLEVVPTTLARTLASSWTFLALGIRLAARTGRPGAGAHEVRRMLVPHFVGVLLKDLVSGEPLCGILLGGAGRLAVR